MVKLNINNQMNLSFEDNQTTSEIAESIDADGVNVLILNNSKRWII